MCATTTKDSVDKSHLQPVRLEIKSFSVDGPSLWTKSMDQISIFSLNTLQAINRNPANNTEACLQHEIQRLTGENFDLRERIETLNENTKRLKRLLKTYMKKLTDVGGESFV